MVLGLERGTIQLTLDSPMKGHGRDACVSLHVDDAIDNYGGGTVRPDLVSTPTLKTGGKGRRSSSFRMQSSRTAPVSIRSRCGGKNCGVACARVPEGADRLNRYRRAAGRHEGYAARVAQRANDGHAEDRWTDTEQLSVGANDHVRRRF